MSLGALGDSQDLTLSCISLKLFEGLAVSILGHWSVQDHPSCLFQRGCRSMCPAASDFQNKQSPPRAAPHSTTWGMLVSFLLSSCPAPLLAEFALQQLSWGLAATQVKWSLRVPSVVLHPRRQGCAFPKYGAFPSLSTLGQASASSVR